MPEAAVHPAAPSAVYGVSTPTATPTAATAGTAPTLLIADDHPLYRMGLRYALAAEGFAVLAEAQSGDEALRRCRELAPDVALLDVKMPGLSGIEVAQQLTREGASTVPVLITTFGEAAIVRAAAQAGARGYFSKESSAPELSRSLRRLLADPALTLLPRVQLPELTPRETQVLALVSQGLSNKAAARELGIGPETVKDHLSRTMQKLECSDRVALVGRARELGLVQ